MVVPFTQGEFKVRVLTGGGSQRASCPPPLAVAPPVTPPLRGQVTRGLLHPPQIRRRVLNSGFGSIPLIP